VIVGGSGWQWVIVGDSGVTVVTVVTVRLLFEASNSGFSTIRKLFEKSSKIFSI
jgi:hypothetical protein